MSNKKRIRNKQKKYGLHKNLDYWRELRKINSNYIRQETLIDPPEWKCISNQDIAHPNNKNIVMANGVSMKFNSEDEPHTVRGLDFDLSEIGMTFKEY